MQTQNRLGKESYDQTWHANFLYLIKNIITYKLNKSCSTLNVISCIVHTQRTLIIYNLIFQIYLYYWNKIKRHEYQFGTYIINLKIIIQQYNLA